MLRQQDVAWKTSVAELKIEKKMLKRKWALTLNGDFLPTVFFFM